MGKMNEDMYWTLFWAENLAAAIKWALFLFASAVGVSAWRIIDWKNRLTDKVASWFGLRP